MKLIRGANELFVNGENYLDQLNAYRDLDSNYQALTDEYDSLVIAKDKQIASLKEENKNTQKVLSLSMDQTECCKDRTKRLERGMYIGGSGLLILCVLFAIF